MRKRWETLSDGRFAFWDGWILVGEVFRLPCGKAAVVWLGPGGWENGPAFGAVEPAKEWVETEAKFREIARLA